MKAKLVLTSKDGQTVQEVPFDRPSITIGRKPTNDLAFNRPEISGSHAAFLLENNQYFVMDLGSTNGTLLNGARLVAKEKYGLQDKDVVTIPPYAIQFFTEEEMVAQTVLGEAKPAAALPENRPPAPPPAPQELPAPLPSPPAAIPAAVPRPVAAARKKNAVIQEAPKTASAITDYLWLGTGVILILTAISLIVFILVAM